MIRSRDVNKELKALDEQAKIVESEAPTSIVQRSILKALTLIIKLLRDVRTNQVRDLEERGVKLSEERKDEK